LSTCIALLRGINVGRAKRIAMADLRALLESLGHTNVRTLLNSGNAIFETPRPNVSKLARAIEASVASKFGFTAPVVVITAAELATIVHAHPLKAVANDPAKYLVAFVATPATLTTIKPLLKQTWQPDALAVGTHAAYLWCAKGVLESKLMQAFARASGETVTTRNWATVLKLHAAVCAGEVGT
jgi:uncharacterized protein (DUF1697 family)